MLQDWKTNNLIEVISIIILMREKLAESRQQ